MQAEFHARLIFYKIIILSDVSLLIFYLSIYGLILFFLVKTSDIGGTVGYFDDVLVSWQVGVIFTQSTSMLSLRKLDSEPFEYQSRLQSS